MVQCLLSKLIVTASRYTGRWCHRTFSTSAGLEVSHVPQKPMFSSAELLLLRPLTESTWKTTPTYRPLLLNTDNVGDGDPAFVLVTIALAVIYPMTLIPRLHLARAHGSDSARGFFPPAFTHSPSSRSRLASRVRPVNYPQSSVENRVYGTVCIENRSSNDSRDLHRKFAINRRGRLGFLFTLQKNCCVRPGSRVKSYLFAGAEKASQTRLAGLVICVYIGGKRRVRLASRVEPASWG